MSSNVIDVGGAVRHGEELDIAAVDRWLKQQVPAIQGQPEVQHSHNGISVFEFHGQCPGFLFGHVVNTEKLIIAK